MRRFMVFLALVPMAGCSATPGFRISMEYLHPPTLRTSQTLTPLPALPTTAYAVDAQGPIPMSQRQYFVQPAPQAPQPPTNTPTIPGRQLLPMPRESVPQAPAGCGNGPCGD